MRITVNIAKNSLTTGFLEADDEQEALVMQVVVLELQD